jgi:cytochrome c-type biogenesis protein CcmH
VSRWWSWALLAVVVVSAFAVGATGDRAPRSETERVNAIAAEVRCPTCASLSAAQSDAAAAQAVRDEIRARLRQGEDKPEILAFLASRYGDQILLKPKAGGVAGLLWVLPVAASIAAFAGLAVAFRRWRRRRPETPTPDDRALVEEALHR